MNARLLVSVLLLLSAATLAHAAPVRVGPVEAELIAERDALVAGHTNWVALRLKPDPQWHVYWRNPGDSGIPTKLEWRLPNGIAAGDIVWPYPQIERLGDLANYGY
ncbi:MAG TPA: protein-disulfide reductase DsbD domain-containing protein, partial [Solimonas sp.]|nr:protein-disulfide reductase DsbD domain-containing protein [Solimonas sp.]